MKAHTATGSCDAIPDELPKDLHADENPSPQVESDTAAPEQIQRCCCKSDDEEGEQTSLLIDNQPNLTTISFGFDEVKRGNQIDVTKDWSKYPKQLRDTYDVFFRVKDRWIEAIAVQPGENTSRLIVATSELEFFTERGILWFTSFGSDPPFCGLGSVVLQELSKIGTKRDLKVEPSKPVPGSYVFYNSQKHRGFTIPEGLEKRIKEGIKQRMNELTKDEFDLTDEKIIQGLGEIQKWVKQTEEYQIMQGKLIYKVPTSDK